MLKAESHALETLWTPRSTRTPLQKNSSTKALATLLIKNAQNSPQKKESPPPLVKSRLSCKNLIHGTLPPAADGKATHTCELARTYCLTYMALKHLAETKKSPFSPEVTAYLLEKLKRKSERWRGYCEIIRLAVGEPKYLNKVFDSRDSSHRAVATSR